MDTKINRPNRATGKHQPRAAVPAPPMNCSRPNSDQYRFCTESPHGVTNQTTDLRFKSPQRQSWLHSEYRELLTLTSRFVVSAYRKLRNHRQHADCCPGRHVGELTILTPNLRAASTKGGRRSLAPITSWTSLYSRVPIRVLMSKLYGGDDRARTRDLCRDSAA